MFGPHLVGRFAVRTVGRIEGGARTVSLGNPRDEVHCASCHQIGWGVRCADRPDGGAPVRGLGQHVDAPADGHADRGAIVATTKGDSHLNTNQKQTTTYTSTP